LQHATAHALGFGTSYYHDLHNKYAASREHILETLTMAGFKPIVPKGSYYVITDVTELFDRLKAVDDFDFSRKLIEKTRVATVPGFSFYSEKGIVTKTVRFAFCKRQETLDAVRKLFTENL
jgi:aminotransferase